MWPFISFNKRLSSAYCVPDTGAQHTAGNQRRNFALLEATFQRVF